MNRPASGGTPRTFFGGAPWLLNWAFGFLLLMVLSQYLEPHQTYLLLAILVGFAVGVWALKNTTKVGPKT